MAFGQKNSNQRLGDRLVAKRLLDKQGWRIATRRARDEGRPLTEVLYENEHLPDDQLLDVLGQHFSAPTVRLRERVISPYVLQLIPKEVAERHQVIIFKKAQSTLHVAVTDFEDEQPIEFIRQHTKLDPEVYLTTPLDIRHALQLYRTDLSQEFQTIIEDGLRDAEGSRVSVEDLAQRVPIMAMVDSLLHRAVVQSASDIHLEPGFDVVTVRFRVDGLLRKIVELPKVLHAPLVARIKLMANLKIDEHRLPQDGRLTTVVNDRTVAVRVSVVPTLHGSKIVLRLLDEKRKHFNLKSLGLNSLDFSLLKKEIRKPNGLILVTGPTGSGKTTTLYTLLRMLNTETVNICTVEDPIEYGLDGVNQTQINPAANLTFANGLRSILRQDPNVIMVGEIRDTDTADIAVNAAMTGHLVLTTIHSNSAAQTVQRLTEIGVQPFLGASTINLIIAQRLVRKVCPHCQRSIRLTDKSQSSYHHSLPIESTIKRLVEVGLLPADKNSSNLSVVVSRGCPKCQDTGYLGRVGIYEIIPNTDAVHAAIISVASPTVIEAAARRDGQLNIVEDGILKVVTGQTTFAEILRVTL